MENQDVQIIAKNLNGLEKGIRHNKYAFNISESINESGNECYLLTVTSTKDDSVVTSIPTLEKYKTIIQNINSFIGGMYKFEVNPRKNKMKEFEETSLRNKTTQYDVVNYIADLTFHDRQDVLVDFISQCADIRNIASEFRRIIDRLYDVKERLY